MIGSQLFLWVHVLANKARGSMTRVGIHYPASSMAGQCSGQLKACPMPQFLRQLLNAFGGTRSPGAQNMALFRPTLSVQH